MPEAAERIGVESYFGIADFIRNTAVYDKTLAQLDKRTSQYGNKVASSTSGAAKSWNSYNRTTDQVVADLRASLTQGEKKVQEYGDENRKVTQQAANSWQQFTSSTIGQVAKLRATLDAGRYMFQAFLKPFQQFIALGTEGAGMARMERNLMRMTGSQEAYNEALGEMREATMGTVRDAELINQAFKIMNLGLADTADQAARVARNVTLLGKASGQVPTPEAAMQVFSLMMSNQSKMRLDAFALSIQEVDARIDSLKDTMGVSEEEAFRLAVYELMDEKVEKMGLAVEDSATKASRMNAAFGNMADSLKTMIVPEFDDFITIVSNLATKITDNAQEIEKWYRLFVGVTRGILYQLGDVALAFVYAGHTASAFFKGDIEGAKEAANTLKGLLGEIVTFTAIGESVKEEAAKMFDNMAESADGAARAQAQAMRQAAEEASSAIADVRSEWDEKLTEVHAQAEKRMADITVRETERAIDAAIAAQRKREDSARETAKRIEQIETQYATALANAMNARSMALANAAKQHSDKMLQIEEDYQRAKRDIMERYELAAWEAISERDATAMLKAQRTRDEGLRDAEENRNRQIDQTNRQYADQTRAAEDAFRQQEQAAKDSYNRQQQELRENLAEQAEEQRIAAERQAEDAQRARERELGRIRQDQGQKIADLYLHYNEELSAAQQHHTDMLNELNRYLRQYANLMRQYRYTGGEPSHAGRYAEGGSFIANKPTNIMVGEGGKPELVIVQPLNTMGQSTPQSSTVNHNVTGEVSARVDAIVQQGLSGFEGRISAALYQALNEVLR